jgi:hypothetical protein
MRRLMRLKSNKRQTAGKRHLCLANTKPEISTGNYQPVLTFATL